MKRRTRPTAGTASAGTSADRLRSGTDWAKEHDRVIRLLEIEAILDDCL